MRSLQDRAFDSAREAGLYPERRGLPALAAIQKDLLSAQGALCDAGDEIWRSMVDREARDLSALSTDETRTYLREAMEHILRICGALGYDPIVALNHDFDSREMTKRRSW